MTPSAKLFGGVVLLAIAGDARADHTLTLDDALALARDHNHELAAARARLTQADANVDIARSALLPSVAAQGRYTHNYKAVTFNFTGFEAATVGLAEAIRTSTTEPALASAMATFEEQTNAAIAATPPIEIQLSEQLDSSLSASVPLVAPSAWYGLSSAQASARSAGANYDVNETTVLIGVAQAYFAAAGTDELVVARQNSVRVADETYQVAKTRFETKVVNEVDVARAETALVRAQQALVEAKNARAAAYRGLATLVGVHDTFVVEARTAPPPPPDEDTAKLVHLALTTRPEIRADRTAIDAARASARSAGWRWSPTLSAWGNAHLSNYTGFSGNKYSWAVGLELDWVLYDGGVRDAQRHIANAQGAEIEARLELEADTIADEVANARGDVDTRRAGVTASDRAVVLAKQALRIIRLQYEEGRALQLDVLQAQDSLVVAEVGLAQAHFDLSLAELQLSRASGAFPGPRLRARR